MLDLYVIIAQFVRLGRTSSLCPVPSRDSWAFCTGTWHTTDRGEKNNSEGFI